MEELKKQLAEAKAEARRRDGIQPDDNLRYLINIIWTGNVEVSEKDRVLNILNEVRMGLVNKDEKIAELRKEIKALKDVQR